MKGNSIDDAARPEMRVRSQSIMRLIGLGSVLLALPLLGGCFGQQNAEEDLEGTVVEEVPVDSEAQADGTAEDNEAVPIEQGADLFTEAMLPGIPEAVRIAQAELLESTDPNERVREVEAERVDPYAYVPIPPAVQPPPPAPDNAASDLPQPGDNANPPAGNNNQQQSPPADAPLPQLPPPTATASQVEISGVASIGGEDYAIVKAPGEPSSRYVKEGDRLSNGTVLVKRIENGPGMSAPVVVLEERGEEIALPVGSNIGILEEPTASVPAPPTNVAVLPVLP